jgi:O-acetyl-ADP-ribose deacetylase (regulator of RNase III)
MEYVIGDATKPSGDGPKVIAHVVNDIGAWGKGFVLALSRRWPRVEMAYRGWSRESSFKLGRVQFAAAEDGIEVANMVAQRGIGMRDGVPPIRYPALKKCLDEVFRHAKEIGASVHMPKIGCGLAGGKWNVVGPMIEEAAERYGVRAVVYYQGANHAV